MQTNDLTEDRRVINNCTTPYATAKAWIDKHYEAGARRIGATCNPIQRKIFLMTENDQLVINCERSGKEVSIIKGMLHDYIGQLP